MEKKSLKLPITLLVLGACWSIVYIIPFIQYIWYDPFQQFMNATNTQMGLLITIYGFGNVFGHLLAAGLQTDSTISIFM